MFCRSDLFSLSRFPGIPLDSPSGVANGCDPSGLLEEHGISSRRSKTFASLTQKKVRGMDAKLGQLWPVKPLVLVTFLAICLDMADQARGADFRTQNFIVMAPTAELARTVGESAEMFRRDLAIYWLGGELPAWPNPCPVRVIAGQNLAAQGVTTYNRAPVRDFQMEVVGSPQRILDSVLPHEVTHTILATYFGRPLPRWADEGICTTVEHESERQKHEVKLREFLSSRRGIAMNKLFLLTEYPSDVLPMYAQGYSVCQFLIAQNGPRSFVKFLGDYMQNPSWTQNIRAHYGYESLAELQQSWLAWVGQGSGPVDAFVKNAPQTGVVPASLVMDTPAADHLIARGASSDGGEAGWYSRLRQEAMVGKPRGESAPSGPASSSPAQTAAAWPRSLGPQPGPQPIPQTPNRPLTHSAAQPQPEQGMAPAGIAAPFPSDLQGSGQYLPGSLSAGGTSWR